MSIRVDFYLLAAPQPEGRYPVLYRLLQKAYQRNHTIYVHATSSQEARQIDEMLWSQPEEGFLPHSLLEETLPLVPPIQIGHTLAGPLPGQHDLLVNFTAQPPQFYAQFQRIIELVPAEPSWRAQARTNYKLYKDHGCTLESHPL